MENKYSTSCNLTSNPLHEDQLEIVKARYNILLKQQMFWVAQDNLQRFHYDLKEYGMWLCDYIADVEREKNGNEGWENYS